MHTPPLRTAGLAFGLLAGLLLAACDSGPGTSLYDPDRVSLPDPRITSISPVAPPDIVLAGIDEITITGENFSEDPARNYVYFNAVRGTVVDASPTQLRVRVPNLPMPELEIRVMVLGAMEFSNSVAYRLTPAVVPVGSFLPTEVPFGMTSDPAGNIYLSLFASEASIGVKRIAPDGTRSDYFASTFAWSDLAVGPGGVLHGVRPASAVFRLPEGGAQQPWAILPNPARPSVLTFGEAGEVWTWSTNTTGAQVLFRIAPEGTIREFPLAGTVRDLTVFGGALYVALTEGTASRIMRYPIAGDGALGPAEEYVIVSAAHNVEARTLAFAADGTLFVGTRYLVAGTAHDPVIVVAPDRTTEVLYPGILGPAASNVSVMVMELAWDGGTGLYALRRFENLQAVSPQRPVTYDLVRIETRRQGT